MRLLALLGLIDVLSSSLYAGGDNVMEVRRATDMIVVHHSETSTGNVESFRRHHIGDNKWLDIGYHFVITNGLGGGDGEIQAGRPVELKGAHAGKATGRNSHSVGVCVVGQDHFTSAQKASLVNTLVWLCQRYGIQPSEMTIQGHHDKCPGPPLDLRSIVAEVQKKM